MTSLPNPRSNWIDILDQVCQIEFEFKHSFFGFHFHLAVTYHQHTFHLNRNQYDHQTLKEGHVLAEIGLQMQLISFTDFDHAHLALVYETKHDCAKFQLFHNVKCLKTHYVSANLIPLFGSCISDMIFLY